MRTNKEQCKNCEQAFDEDFQFCPHCGQKTNDELTLGLLFYNTISNYFSFDARFIKSFIPLLFRPGFLAKEFIKGKRLLYLHPAQMYLFISVVFFFIFSFTVREQTDSINEEFKNAFDNKDETMLDPLELKKIDSLDRIEIREALEQSQFFTGISKKEIDSIASLEDLPKKNSINLGSKQTEIDSLIAINAPNKEIYKVLELEADDGWFKRKFYQQGLKLYKTKDAGNVWSMFYDTVPIALFFVLPLFAFIIKLFYFRRGRYAHHLVFSFYYFSFIFTALCLVFGINSIFEISDWTNSLVTLFCFIYLFFALKRFYGQGWFLSFIKTGFVTLIFLPVISLTAIVILFFAFMFY
ncbi:MAG: DUF3667 domain-containing protein [Winogradskyella sp.]|uniref:DUF3667 domain-containing protein n=1 Tax=Winogradskyella sp. TaxID=1883156 RepID=UPI0038585EDC